MTWCAATVTCACRGREHGACLLQAPGGPARAGIATELRPNGKLPPATAELMGHKRWCDAAQAYLEQPDPGKAWLEPRE